MIFNWCYISRVTRAQEAASVVVGAAFLQFQNLCGTTPVVKKWPTGFHLETLHLSPPAIPVSHPFFQGFSQIYITAPLAAIGNLCRRTFREFQSVLIGGSRCASNRLRNTKSGWWEPWVLKTHRSITKKYLCPWSAPRGRCTDSV